jgi:hypothetical protein
VHLERTALNNFAIFESKTDGVESNGIDLMMYQYGETLDLSSQQEWPTQRPKPASLHLKKGQQTALQVF